MTKKIIIEIVTKEDDDPDVTDTLKLIGNQIAGGCHYGFDRRDDERYHYDVSNAKEDDL